MRKIDNNVQGFKKNEMATHMMKLICPTEGGELKGVYDYKKLMIIYSIENEKGHLSVSHKFHGEIYDDDLERIAKKFMKDKEWYIEKGVIGGIVHIWEK